MSRYFIYILTNRRYGVLYIGVTNNLARRVLEHRQKLVPGFTKTWESVNSSTSKNIRRSLRPDHVNMF